ncbi:hypothetical protein [Cellulophaga sp. Hel_I_12]|uniref:hypothetical protein n=1 Tax=Cellulophaga sp. Hel_I_12 TaxID=1249972 RepID=UPI00064850D7|nr:hypothetical protein [Cellulophaga sp. Hel_I_12]
MKNLGLTLAAFVFLLACNTEKKHTDDTDQEPQEVKAPKQLISIPEAKNGYDNYTNKRVKLIEASEDPSEDGSKFIASRFGEYDLETVKNYIAYVEQEAKASGVKVETLRFYFSTYPDKKEDAQHREIKHPRQNTFFILPTMKVDSINLGFYIKRLSNGKKEALLIRDYPGILGKGLGQTTTTQKSFASMLPIFKKNAFQDDDESLILNDSHMQPPPEQGSDFN